MTKMDTQREREVARYGKTVQSTERKIKHLWRKRVEEQSDREVERERNKEDVSGERGRAANIQLCSELTPPHRGSSWADCM